MERNYSVRLAKVVSEYNALHVVYAADDYSKRLITTADLNRPGLQLMGYYKYFDNSRIQLMGKAETFLMTEQDRQKRLEAFFSLMSRHIPALIVCHGQEILPEFLQTVQPAYAVITCSDKEPEDSETVSALTDAGAQVFLTRKGPVLAESDGTSLRVQYDLS